MHYCGIALNIEEAQERHQWISSILIRWTLERAIHKKLLEHAYRTADPEKFNAILDDLQHLKSFCGVQKDFNALIDQAYQVLTEAPIESRLESFKVCTEKLRSINQTLSEPGYISQKYRHALKKYRNQFNTSNPPTMLDLFKELFEIFLEDAFLLVGSPPCGYDLRALGSVAKKSPCPYSDLEWFILIENKKHLSYFQNLAEVIELQFISLGETAAGVNIPVFTALGPKHRSGLHIEPGANPALKSNTVELISEPVELANSISEENINNNDDLATSLLQSVSLKTNDSSLHASFQSQIDPEVRKKKALEAIEDRKALYAQTWTADPEQLQEYNLKTEFITFLNFLISDFGLYFGIEATSPEEILHELKKINILEDAELIEQVFKQIYTMRIQLHLQASEQKDTASAISLAPNERTFLCMTYRFILKPLYNCIDKVLEGRAINLFAEAPQCNTKEELKPLIKSFVQAIHKINPPPEKYHDYLIQIEDSSLRCAYLEALEELHVDIAALAQIPATDGFRYAQVQDTLALEQALKKITTQDPSDVQVTSPSLGKVYLKPQVADQILDCIWDIRRLYKDCLHPVASLTDPQLHFKQKPNHPLLEYAIHTLTYRIMGRATPPTELARFEVRGNIYPVLISRTIIGSRLKTVSLGNIDSAHLTWMLLCAILTRPGDGKGANYILGVDGKIYCIDNDVSLVELMSSGRLFKQTNICSLLFCVSQEPLDKDTLIKFTELDPESILHSWIEELIEKEKEYTRLFTKEERKKLYEEDKENRFTPFLLLKEGAISTLRLQFIHLQQTLKARLNNPLYAQDLLQMLISIKDTPQQTSGIQVAKQYAKSSTKTPSERLKAATGVAAQSKSTSQTMEATFGKILTFEEIEKRDEYSLEKAKEELSFLIVHRYTNTENATLLQKGNNGSLHVPFEAITQGQEPDLSRQELILKALHLHIELKHFPKPQEVTLSHCAALKNVDLLPFLSNNLRFLDLRNCPKITGAAIEQIAKRCPNLEELYLSGSGIDAVAGYGIASWQPLNMPKLQTLHIARCKKLETIKLNAPELRMLKADKCHNLKETDIGVAFLYAEVKLKDCPLNSVNLELNFNSLEINIQEVLLRILSINPNPISKRNPVLYQFFCKQLGQNEVTKLIKEEQNQPLTTLHLWRRQIGAQTAKALAASLRVNLSLESLNLPENKIGAEGTKAFAASLEINQTLQRLDLSDNQIGIKGVKALAVSLEKNQALQQLVLTGNKIGAEGAKALAASLEKNQTLQGLSLSHNEIGVPEAKILTASLKMNYTLKELNLWGNKLENEGAEVLAAFLETNQTLQILYLPANGIGVKGVKALAVSLEKNQTLQELYLEDNNIRAEGAKALAAALQVNRALQILSLEHNEFGAEGAKALAVSLETNQSLLELRLLFNEIGEEGAKALVTSLEKNQALQKFRLSFERIGDEGAKALAASLEKNRTLQELELSYTKIGNKEAKALAASLEKNHTLQRLKLDGNQIGDEGAKALAASLEKNHTLQKLMLWSNQIGDEGAKALAASLEKNHTLQKLELWGNQIGDEGAKALAASLEKNHTLQKLELWGNQIEDVGKEALLELQKKKPNLEINF
ncbi:MAG: hypothetical protein K1000chlam2_00932 [Chlamydiae bacterium]|nr:hypothetical protein [Chlamydiota bacterium]